VLVTVLLASVDELVTITDGVVFVISEELACIDTELVLVIFNAG
jgi:hypothetical protein